MPLVFLKSAADAFYHVYCRHLPFKQGLVFFQPLLHSCLVTHKPIILDFKSLTVAWIGYQIKTFVCCHFPFILIYIFIYFALSSIQKLNVMVFMQVGCLSALHLCMISTPWYYGHTGCILGKSNYTLYALTEAP